MVFSKTSSKSSLKIAGSKIKETMDRRDNLEKDNFNKKGNDRLPLLRWAFIRAVFLFEFVNF